MKKHILLSTVVFLSACNSTPPAKGISGAWRPLNEFPTQTTEIPLVQQHYYAPLRIDVTLKAMLTRWAKDAGMTLQYDYVSDYTIYSVAAAIRQPNLDAALSELQQAYAAQGLSIYAQSGRIIVRGQNQTSAPSTFMDPESPTVMPVLTPPPPLPILAPPPPLPTPPMAPKMVVPAPAAEIKPIAAPIAIVKPVPAPVVIQPAPVAAVAPTTSSEPLALFVSQPEAEAPKAVVATATSKVKVTPKASVAKAVVVVKPVVAPVVAQTTPEFGESDALKALNTLFSTK